ncbi:phosphoenolpyruvate--protein phosphotransferase [Salsuginibacillus halophilus]|uniref:Phosphoenolpyruvate-protein phosphotransferase n=1 Tax=Salsuginibacillus halophilus TaxID=517424 RepID=A0A2P8HCX7_9BACI|nr:phosphoenolpyruvate--protein phosphotransferase [Salsuginibacillus halophilus]PSL44022.1 phosphoenolpyruvate--protein phosphotransferase [Salsuginibacillus halophilus]
MTTTIEGIAASRGYAIAEAFILEAPDTSFHKTKVEDPEAEKSRFQKAVTSAKQELEAIKAKTLKEQGEENAEIFSAHLLVLEDPELLDAVYAKVTEETMNAEAALTEVSDMYVTMFEGMDNEYMKERASDIRDVSTRVLHHLLGVTHTSLQDIATETIVFAEDLTPSDTAQLNRDYTLGFVTNIGGRTSHSAIMARSLELPAVVGTKEATTRVQHGDQVIVDGFEGIVIINPDENQLREYEKKQKAFEAQKAEWEKLVNESSVTADGKHVELAANIGTPEDMTGVQSHGAEGIGLYRTEFLYMGRNELPDEEEQFNAYRSVVEPMNGKPVVIRTLDIGGDKELPYLDLPEEMNPFLGYRAIRLCLEETDMFRVQLRALLRASAYGNLKIMFPMVATLEEFREAKALLDEERQKLKSEGTDVSDDIEVGIMVEIPATAVHADIFAKEVDFFSIGTNDLIQYTLAVDRMSEKVSHLYQPYHPAVLRLVQQVITAAHNEGKWAGMCGEMAGEETAIPLLLGLGLDEFSMSATSVLPARSLIRSLSVEKMERLAAEALRKSTAEEVAELVREKVTSDE